MIKPHAFVLLLALAAGISAAEPGPYSSRQALSAQAALGDTESGWRLGWLYFYENRFDQAWIAIQALPYAEQADKVYLRAWLQASRGDAAGAAATLAEGHCDLAECQSLSGAMAIKSGKLIEAEHAYVLNFERRPGPETLVEALMACLAASDYIHFDALTTSVDWRNAAEFGQAKARVAELLKDRDLLGKNSAK